VDRVFFDMEGRPVVAGVGDSVGPDWTVVAISDVGITLRSKQTEQTEQVPIR
jgi:hypothetical protein